MTVKEFLVRTYDKDNWFTVRESIGCADGFSISVQGGTAFHYCRPREHCNVYEAVELGFPSENDELIEPFRSDNDVYANVPIEVVEVLISKHGGIINGWTQYPENPT